MLHFGRGRLVHLDCGRDEWYRIHCGARLLSLRLTEDGVEHTYEGRRQPDIDYRMDTSLPFLGAGADASGGLPPGAAR